MSLTNSAETALLNLLFNNTDWANIGDAAGLQNSVAAGSFYASLHTADPGEAGSQTTSEVAYTGYARVAIARTSGGFTISGNQVTLAATVSFPAGTGGSGTVTHFGIGTDATGAGNLLFKGPYTPNQAVGNGITPKLTTGTTITVD